MVRNYIPKVRVWTEASVEKALHEVKNSKKSVNSTAKKYHLSTSLLHKRLLASMESPRKQKQVC